MPGEAHGWGFRSYAKQLRPLVKELLPGVFKASWKAVERPVGLD